MRGLPAIRLHDLRHTMATTALQSPKREGGKVSWLAPQRNVDCNSSNSVAMFRSCLRTRRNSDDSGTVSAVKLGSVERFVSPVGSGRRVPGWAAELVAGLARERPSVVTRSDIALRLAEAGSVRDVDATVSELRRLGWLVGLPVQGVWAFLAPGEDESSDQYLLLRAWLARDHPGFVLAGANAAWHLGYLDRQPADRIQVWLPPAVRVPDGLRPYVSAIQIHGPGINAANLAPRRALIVRRKLDLSRWAGGLEAFGPEAILVQLAARPASFGPWADLVAHLDRLADDCDDERLAALLVGQSSSAWQRAGYLLHAAGHRDRGAALLEHRPAGPMPKIRFDDRATASARAAAVWVPRYQLQDQLIAPLQAVLGKA